MFDVYPYIAYSTGLTNLFPVWAREGGTAAFLQRLDDPTDAPRIEAAVRDKIAMLGSWDAVQMTAAGGAEYGWVGGRRLGALAGERGVEPYAPAGHHPRRPRTHAHGRLRHERGERGAEACTRWPWSVPMAAL
jgi:hypothetical protein